MTADAPTGPLAGVAARTVAAGSARVFAAWCSGTPVPGAGDRRSDGMADFRARRAHLMAAPFLTDRYAGVLAASADRQSDDDAGGAQEEIYDGAASYLRVKDVWTTFGGAVEPSGPRGSNDPLWPLDALFGANDDGVAVGAEDVRGEPATRYRLSVDLGLADALVPAGVSVPSGPYRSLRRLPAEVWLDSAGLARRIAIATDPTAAADSQVWAVLEMWDFGLPVEITPPGSGDLLPPAEAYQQAYGDTGDTGDTGGTCDAASA